MPDGVLTSGASMNGDLFRLAEALCDVDRSLLWRLCRDGHAGIEELRDAAGGAGDYEILTRLREGINGMARRLLGRPAVRFEELGSDPRTGEPVCFHWWLPEACGEWAGVGRPVADVFDEGGHVAVFAEVPASVSLEGVELECRNGILQVRLRKEKEDTVGAEPPERSGP